MNTVDRVKEICKDRSIPISKLERDCDFSNGYISGLRKGSIRGDRLKIIADYLDVSLEYLLNEDDEVPKKGHEMEYYDPETLEMAQALYENPDLRALMKAAMTTNKESIPTLTKLLYDMKGTNPDG